MGNILTLKKLSYEKVQVNLELAHYEFVRLQGHLDKMHIFSENNFEYETRLVQRGKSDATKYILVPKEFRKNMKPSNNVKCTNIETKTQNILIFSINKY